VAFPRRDCVHLILGPTAVAVAAALQELLRPAIRGADDARVQARPDASS
jgi:hypothetical protein